MNAWKLCLLLPVLWQSGAAIAADADDPDGEDERDPELEEVLVTGARKKVRTPDGIVAWLNRLVGQFNYEGYVELGSEEAPRNRLAVTGSSKCGAFGPSVNCVMQVAWPETRGSNGEDLPGGVSTLAPAMAVYSLDLNYLAVNSLQVDNRGMADSGLGYLKGDTLTTTTACVDLPGSCQRIASIDAQPDGKLIRMQIDIEQEDKRVVRYSFLLRRVGAEMPGRNSGSKRR